MGRGNVSTKGLYEGLFYVDYCDFYAYYHNGEVELLRNLSHEDLKVWEYDQDMSQENYDNFKDCLVSYLTEKFKSFEKPSEKYLATGEVILSNGLFHIVLADNEWSVAVELIQVEPEDWRVNIEPLQKYHYKRYLEVIRDALFEQFDNLGTYNGPWTSNTITNIKEKEKVNEKKEIACIR